MWLKIGNEWVMQDAITENSEKLKAGNYLLSLDDKGRYHLHELPKYDLPKKLYGTVKEDSEMILTAFKELDKPMGVAAIGKKGQGKTILLKKIAADSNIPVLIVREPVLGTEFLNYARQCFGDTPFVIFLDEFDKVYSEREEQENLLSILDGSSTSGKILWLFSSNQVALNQYMENRPERVRYVIRARDISIDLLNEILEDKLEGKRKKLIPEFERAHRVYNFNIDSIISLIQEVNRLKKPNLSNILRTFNISVEDYTWKLVAYETAKPKLKGDCFVYTHPLGGQIKKSLYITDGKNTSYYLDVNMDKEFFEKAKNVKISDNEITLEHGKHSFSLTKNEEYNYVF